MKHILSESLIFIAGAVIGSAITWKLAKTKYERIAQEEIESVREMYSKYSSKTEQSVENVENCDEYENIAKIYKGDMSYSKEEEDTEMIKPYVIPPDEFDEEGYETVTLYYYENGILEDQLSKEIIDNVDELIGEDSLTHFGEYEDDSVFVRNDRLRIDYEILKVNERYEV